MTQTPNWRMRLLPSAVRMLVMDVGAAARARAGCAAPPRARPGRWPRARPRRPGAPAAQSLGFVPPCLATKAPQPPTGGAWLHEIKHDGFRVIGPRWKSGRPKGRPVFYYSPVSVDGNNQNPCEERSNTRCSSQVRGLISGVCQIILGCPGYAPFG